MGKHGYDPSLRSGIQSITLHPLKPGIASDFAMRLVVVEGWQMDLEAAPKAL
jgi:hypothetical protein